MTCLRSCYELSRALVIHPSRSGSILLALVCPFPFSRCRPRALFFLLALGAITNSAAVDHTGHNSLFSLSTGCSAHAAFWAKLREYSTVTVKNRYEKSPSRCLPREPLRWRGLTECNVPPPAVAKLPAGGFFERHPQFVAGIISSSYRPLDRSAFTEVSVVPKSMSPPR